MMEWIVIHWQSIMAVLAVGVAILVAYARGELATLAGQVVALVLQLSSKELEDVTEGDIGKVAPYLYTRLPAWVRTFVTDMAFAQLCWAVWQALVKVLTASEKDVRALLLA